MLLLREELEETRTTAAAAEKFEKVSAGSGSVATGCPGGGSAVGGMTRPGSNSRVDMDQAFAMSRSLTMMSRSPRSGSPTPGFHDSGVGSERCLTLTEDMRRQVEALGAKAAFTLQAWGDLEGFVTVGTTTDQHNQSNSGGEGGGAGAGGGPVGMSSGGSGSSSSSSPSLDQLSSALLAAGGDGGQWAVDRPFYEAVLEVCAVLNPIAKTM